MADVIKTTTQADIQAQGDRRLISAERFARYDVAGQVIGKLLSATELFQVFVFPVAMTMIADCEGCYAKALTAATAEKIFVLKQNGTQVATFTFAAAGTVATFSAQDEVAFAAGDKLAIYGPATVDATLADIGWTLVFSVD